MLENIYKFVVFYHKVECVLFKLFIMRAKMLQRSTMVAVILLMSAALFAGSSGISCEGIVRDQFGDPIEDVLVRSTVNAMWQDITDENGHYSLSNLPENSTIEVVVPEGFSSTESTESQKLIEQSNVVDFTLHDNSFDIQ